MRKYLTFVVSPQMMKDRGATNASVAMPAVVIDPYDSPKRRYKMFMHWGERGGGLTGMAGVDKGNYTLVSPDGINWKITGCAHLENSRGRGWAIVGDTSICCYDEMERRFLAFLKLFCRWEDLDVPKAKKKGSGEYEVRCRGLSVSKDFVNWTRPRLTLVPDKDDPVTTQFYTSNGFWYESTYLGFLGVYQSLPDDIIHVQLISSKGRGNEKE